MINGKPVIINGEETQYFLFENGDLYNANTHRISQGSKNHGYIRYSLTINGKETSSETSSASLKAGTKVNLNNIELYVSATASNYSTKKSGTYYIYSDEISNNRIRITNSENNVGKTPAGKYVSGWIKTSDVK